MKVKATFSHFVFIFYHQTLCDFFGWIWTKLSLLCCFLLRSAVAPPAQLVCAAADSGAI